MVPPRAPIVYRDFYDVPRVFVVRVGDRAFLLDCQFDASADEYADSYTVYGLEPGFIPPEGSWLGLAERATERLGTIPVAAIDFDPTRREFIDPQVPSPFLRNV